ALRGARSRRFADGFIIYGSASLQLQGFGRIVNSRECPRLPPRPRWLGGVFNPAPTLEKESLYEFDDQRSPS
ncbi:MAG: hypothetical protein ACREBY_11530, partial [Polaromonas sp.]